MNDEIGKSEGRSLNLLLEGNTRFLKRLDSANNSNIAVAPLKLVSGAQSPFCAILSCSDSRVSPEFIFDQGIGDLFVIRVAGNGGSTSAIASIEYAVLQLKVPLIVVLGHSGCGAIHAALDREATGDMWPTESLYTLSKQFRPSVMEATNTMQGKKHDHVLDYAVRLNIQNSIQSILHSPALHEAQEKNKVEIVGAFYSLDTGKVDFI
jgi:carbonic anhydrase